MKKLFIYSMLALSGFILPSCGEEDPKPSDKSTPTIEGQWLVTRVESQAFSSNDVQIGATKTETSYPNYSLTFNAPSEFKEELTGSNPKSATGTYSYLNSQLNINNPNKVFFNSGNYQVDSLTSNRLVFKTTIPATATTNKMIVTYRSKR